MNDDKAWYLRDRVSTALDWLAEWPVSHTAGNRPTRFLSERAAILAALEEVLADRASEFRRGQQWAIEALRAEAERGRLNQASVPEDSEADKVFGELHRAMSAAADLLDARAASPTEGEEK